MLLEEVVDERLEVVSVVAAVALVDTTVVAASHTSRHVLEVVLIGNEVVGRQTVVVPNDVLVVGVVILDVVVEGEEEGAVLTRVDMLDEAPVVLLGIVLVLVLWA